MMPFSSSQISVSVQVPATSANLGPGFDALGIALGLYNRLELGIGATDSLEVSGEGEAELSRAKTTIAHEAAKRVLAALGHEVAGVHLRLQNAIPLARGLGSSSAAIVGAMLAANEWSLQQAGSSLEHSTILQMACDFEGHPDNVAPALIGGLVVAALGQQGRVSAVKVAVKSWPRFVAFIPDTELSTQFARGVLPESYSRADAIFNLSRSALLVAALGEGDFGSLGEALQDKIHQPFRAPFVPGWNEVTAAAREAGAIGVTLSGAGPTILSWVSAERTEAVAQAMREAADKAKAPGRIMILDAVEEGGAKKED